MKPLAYDEIRRDRNGRMIAHPCAIAMAYDQNPEEGESRDFDASWVVNRLAELLFELPPDEQEAVREEMKRLASASSAEQWLGDLGEDRRRRAGDGRRRRAGARDRHRLAGDAAPTTRDFARRYPWGARIGLLG